MKCAVSDFDRTFSMDGAVSRENREAVRRWQQAGHWFVIATGRNEASLRKKLAEDPELGEVRPDVLILNNGALILDREGRELFCRELDRETAAGVLAYFDGQDEAGSGITLRYRKLNVVRELGMATTQRPCDGEILLREAEKMEGILQVHHRRPDSTEEITRMCREINSLFPHASAYSNVRNADVVAKGVGKAQAVRFLQERFGPFEEILTIGDSANDTDMIREFQGAAVPAAVPEVRAAAAEQFPTVAAYLNSRLEVFHRQDNF